MFSKPFAHWHVLTTCTCPEEIPRPTWEYIQNVARRIAQADFTAGSAAEMGARLRASLGFADWAELKNAASLEADLIDFKSISDTIQNEFDGSISRYESAQDHGFEATHKKIQRLRKRRGLCLRKRTGRPAVPIAPLFDEIDDEGRKQSLIERYWTQRALAKIHCALNKKRDTKT